MVSGRPARLGYRLAARSLFYIFRLPSKRGSRAFSKAMRIIRQVSDLRKQNRTPQYKRPKALKTPSFQGFWSFILRGPLFQNNCPIPLSFLFILRLLRPNLIKNKHQL
jgi:hypothetical protein